MKRPSIHIAKKVANCEHCGFTHDSKMEYYFCTRIHLKMRAQGSEITYIDVFPRVTLGKGISWKLDFCIWRIVSGHLSTEFIDVKSEFYAKGKQGEAFRLKRKMFNAEHPAAPLKVLCLKGKQWVEL